MLDREQQGDLLSAEVEIEARCGRYNKVRCYTCVASAVAQSGAGEES